MANNNEKIQNLISSKSSLEELVSTYLDQLKERYEWTQSTRSVFFTTRRSINDVANDLNKAIKKENKKDDAFETLVARIKSEANRLNQKYEDTYHDTERGLDELASLSSNDLTVDFAASMSSYISNQITDFSCRRLINLLDKRQIISPTDHTYIESLKVISIELKQAVQEHMKGFKKFFEDGNADQLRSIVSSISSELAAFNLDEEASKLNEALNSLNLNSEPSRPNPEELIDILHETRSPVMYISRGYTVLEYVKPVYKSMNYFQRSLREGREYVGTKNSWDKYISDLNSLEEYYYTHYVQVGGKPRNYHGHRAGEHA